MSENAKLAEAADVVMCYQIFLRREPESNAAIVHHLENGPTIQELVKRFADSREYEPIKIDDGCAGIWRRQDGRDVRIEASPIARDKILGHVKKVWSTYGSEDPYYSVLTNPAFRANNITTELTENFYESGVSGVASLKLAFERNAIDIDSDWRILELGCGVGRIGEHFCHEFRHYVGVDISANHLDLAIKRFANKNINNANFLLLNDALKGQVDFDVFYSIIVLQHNPPPVIYYLLDRFLAKLKPDGFVFFQLPCHLYGYHFDVTQYLENLGEREVMEMHALPQRYVFELLNKHGLQMIEIWPLPVIGPIGISYVFFARKEGTAQSLP